MSSPTNQISSVTLDIPLAHQYLLTTLKMLVIRELDVEAAVDGLTVQGFVMR